MILLFQTRAPDRTTARPALRPLSAPLPAKMVTPPQNLRHGPASRLAGSPPRQATSPVAGAAVAPSARADMHLSQPRRSLSAAHGPRAQERLCSARSAEKNSSPSDLYVRSWRTSRRQDEAIAPPAPARFFALNGRRVGSSGDKKRARIPILSSVAEVRSCSWQRTESAEVRSEQCRSRRSWSLRIHYPDCRNSRC